MASIEENKEMLLLEKYFAQQGRAYCNCYGFGKIILFGEHFVVYGAPAIAAALDLKTVAMIRPFYGQGILIEDHTMKCNVLVGYTDDYILDQAVQRILRLLGINWEQENLSILLKSNIPVVGGLGTSTAALVALTRLFSEYFHLNLSDYEISQLVWEGEKVFAGAPSGIDNAISTYGGLIWFQKGENKTNNFSPIKSQRPLYIVIGNTRISHNTKELVTKVRKRIDNNPQRFRVIYARVNKIVREAKFAFLNNDLDIIGKLMNENHMHLRTLGVSCEELEHLILIARKNGALGAKLTGAGGGGCMIALTPDTTTQTKVANAIEQTGFQAIKTVIK
ncbi:MAG: mevalonate kinase [Candidatus Hodarchaeota archaeon]